MISDAEPSVSQPTSSMPRSINQSMLLLILNRCACIEKKHNKNWHGSRHK